MLSEILDKIITKSSGHIITNARIASCIKNKESYNLEIIDDSRSAAFFAFGESKISGLPSILIIDEEDSASTYTAITEAHYQDVSIFILLISQNEFWDFWDFCIEKKYIINNDNDLRNIEQGLQNKLFSPILIKFFDNNFINNMNMKLPKIEVELEKMMDEETQIFIHNIDYYSQSDKIILDKNSKYGILSRYVGYIQFSNSKDILICREEDIQLDVNVFNSKYINNNFKVIVISNNSSPYNFEKWIVNNNIIYDEEVKLREENIKKILNSQKPYLLMIKGGK